MLVNIVSFLIFLVVLFLFRIQILSFIFPQNYALVEILEVDNNVRSWIQKKNSSLSFKFNEGVYYMFTGEDRFRSPSIYRKGRLAKFYYVEGNPYPLDYRNIKLTGDAKLNAQVETIQMNNLFFEDDNNFLDLFKKYWWVIPIIILFMVVFRGS